MIRFANMCKPKVNGSNPKRQRGSLIKQQIPSFTLRVRLAESRTLI